MHKAPFVFDETSDPDKFWKKDFFDEHIPKEQGFISDYVYATRGIEVPTIFNVWNALFALSSTIKREAWVQWFPDKFFANLFIILVAPPGLAKKSTSINMVETLLSSITENVKDINMKEIKKIFTLKNKATPEAMLEFMLPKNRSPRKIILKDHKGYPIIQNKQPLCYYRTSETVLLLSELAVMFSKQTYSDSMVETLMDLYDPKESWTWYTIKRGGVILKKLYTTLLGATTPKGFKDSIPKAALGDGFLSRTILVYCPKTTRRFTIPKPVRNGPDIKHLCKSLAWVAENITGEFRLNDEALESYKEWYSKFKDDLEYDIKNQGIKSRKDINVLKVAFLLCVQRYPKDNIITKEDFDGAVSLIEATYKSTPMLLSELEAGTFHTNVKAVSAYIESKKKVQRRQLLQNMRLSAVEISSALEQLSQSGYIKIINTSGNLTDHVSKNGTDFYIWRNQK